MKTMKKVADKAVKSHESRMHGGKKPPMPFKKATRESMPFTPKRGSKR